MDNTMNNSYGSILAHDKRSAIIFPKITIFTENNINVYIYLKNKKWLSFS